MGFSSGMAQAFGAGVSATGAYNMAAAQRAALQNQGQIASWQATQAQVVGDQQAAASGMHTEQVLGQQAAGLAANGVTLNSGSAVDLMASTKFMGLRDQMTIRDNALRTAWAYQTEANVDKTMAGNISPDMSAASSLLGGASQVAGTWSRWRQAGGTLPNWNN